MCHQIEPQYVLSPLPHRSAKCSPTLEPCPIAGSVLSGDEHHDRRSPLAINGRQFPSRHNPSLPLTLRAEETTEIQFCAPLADRAERAVPVQNGSYLRLSVLRLGDAR